MDVDPPTPPDDFFSALPEEIFSIIAGFVSQNAGVNVIEPSQSPWFRLRQVNRGLFVRSTDQLILNHINRHNILMNECATALTNQMSTAPRGEINRIEQQSNKLYDLRRRVEMIEAGLQRFRKRQALVDSERLAQLNQTERNDLLNPYELSELLILAAKVLHEIQSFLSALKPSAPTPGAVFPYAGRNPLPQPWVPVPAPGGPWPHPAYGPHGPEPDPDMERMPGFNDDFDRDLNPFPDPFAPPQFPHRRGPPPGGPKGPAPPFDPFHPPGPGGARGPFGGGGPRGGGGGGVGGYPRII